MSRTADTLVFASAVVSLLAIAAIRLSGMAMLRDLQALLGIYLVFFPVGALLCSAMLRRETGLAETIMLAIALSVPSVVFGVLVSYFILNLPMNFLNSAIVVGAEAVFLYAICIVRPLK
ncbi:MAG: hypothetical protein V1676_06455 [Candidatus Diapherotrites archaeon]